LRLYFYDLGKNSLNEFYNISLRILQNFVVVVTPLKNDLPINALMLVKKYWLLTIRNKYRQQITFLSDYAKKKNEKHELKLDQNQNTAKLNGQQTKTPLN